METIFASQLMSSYFDTGKCILLASDFLVMAKLKITCMAFVAQSKQ
jgi:hypothetical protein